MRATFIALLLSAVVACHSSAPAAGANVRYRTVATGSTSLRSEPPRRQIAYTPTQPEYLTLWSSLVGEGPAPPIDFERESVLIIFGGQRPTGGYKISPQSITREGEKLVVVAPIVPPAKGSMTIQVLTAPYVVLAIEKVDVTHVNWKNPE